MIEDNETKEEMVEMIKDHMDKYINTIELTTHSEVVAFSTRMIYQLRRELYELEAFEEYDYLTKDALNAIEEFFVEER